MNWLQGLLFGLISGFTEFLPISSHAHQDLLLQLFGLNSADPICKLAIHTALIISLYAAIRPLIEQIRREQNIYRRSRGRRSGFRTLDDVRIVKNAAVPMIVGMLVLSYVLSSRASLPLVALFLIINGILLYLPERMIQGNKDAGRMSQLDSILIGIAGALSAFTGISRVGISTSVALARGADRQKALNWSLLLSFPALAALICLDVFSIIADVGAISLWTSIPSYLLSFIGALISGYCGVKFIKFLTLRVGYAGFAYYSWGAALFTFLLYLAVV